MHAPKPPLCQVAIGAFYEQHLIHEQTTCLPPRRGEVSPQVTERGRKRRIDTAQFHQYPTENVFQNPISFVPPKDVQGVLEKSCGLFNPERGKSLLLPKA